MRTNRFTILVFDDNERKMKTILRLALVAVALSASPGFADDGCKPVRTYTYELPHFKMLSYRHPVTVIHATVPDTGRALAVFTGAFRSSAPVVQYWSAGISVGDVKHPRPGVRPIRSALGDDLFAGNVHRVTLVGYGELDAKHHRVAVRARTGSTVPQDDAVTVLGGALLTVYVEDPACPERDIRATSVRIDGGNRDWSRNLSQDLEIGMESRANTSLRVFSAVEGTGYDLDGMGADTALVIDEERVASRHRAIHAAPSMSHIVMTNAYELPSPALGVVHTIQHLVRASANHRIGTLTSCCGDSVLGAVNVPHGTR